MFHIDINQACQSQASCRGIFIANPNFGPGQFESKSIPAQNKNASSVNNNSSQLCKGRDFTAYNTTIVIYNSNTFIVQGTVLGLGHYR